MKIVVVGRGSVGGGLAGLWKAAGHEVDAFGRDGGDATGADVIVVALPSDAIAEGLGKVTGLSGQISIDASNARYGRNEDHASLAHEVKAIVGGPAAKAFNINFAALYDQASEQRATPSNFYAADAEADEVVAQLIRDAGYDPVLVGDLEMARALEEYAPLAGGIAEAGTGMYFYRVAAPGEL